MSQTASVPSVIRPCDLSAVEEQLQVLWPEGRRLPGILAFADGASLADAAALFVRVAFRGTVRPHRVFFDVDDDRFTGWWTDGLPASGSGWDLMVGDEGRLYRHEGSPRSASWLPVEHRGYARSQHASSVDLRIPTALFGTAPTRVRIGVAVSDDWAPDAFLPGAAYPAQGEIAPPGDPVMPRRLAIHLGRRPWIVRGCATPDDAASAFAAFGDVVLGGALEAAEGDDRDKASLLLGRIRANAASTETWGRVSAAGEAVVDDVRTVLERAKSWRSMGVTGIFLDDAGLCHPAWQDCPRGPAGEAVALTRSRQRAIVDGIHELGLAVFARAAALLDVVGPADGDPGVLGGHGVGRAADMVLVECPGVRAGEERTGVERKILDAQLEIGRSVRRLRGVRLAAVDTVAGPADDGASRTAIFRRAWTRATTHGVDAYGFTNAAYSATPELESNLAIVDLPPAG